MRSTLHIALCTLLTLGLAVCSVRYLRDFWLFSLIHSLQLHFTLALTAGAVLALLLRRNAYSIALLVWAAALAAHAFTMTGEFAADPSRQALAAQRFRLLSFNIMSENGQNGARIADYILNSDADIAIVLEAAPLLASMQTLSAAYPYRIGCTDPGEECDLLLLSRHPLAEVERVSLSDLRKNRFAMASVELGGRKVNVAAAHLSKPYYDRYHFFELYTLAGLIGAVEGPLILAGDFNAGMLAPDMRGFASRMRLSTAPEEPSTWPVRAGRFGIAIDHVFARAPLELIATRRIPGAFGSNHYGLISDFSIPASASP